jgi:predicted transcriptional regulator
MKNVTLSADGDLIEQVRTVARAQHKALNAAFREWLEQYTARSASAQEVDSLMKRLRHVRAGRHYTRAEMNERWILLQRYRRNPHVRNKHRRQGLGLQPSHYPIFPALLEIAFPRCRLTAEFD